MKPLRIDTESIVFGGELAHMPVESWWTQPELEDRAAFKARAALETERMRGSRFGRLLTADYTVVT